jgi:SIR2-like domain
MALAVLLGNGLSVAVNPALRLDALTERFLESHNDDREGLNRLLAEVDLENLDPARDFEAVVGGLEAAEEIVSAFMGLASRIEQPHLQEAAKLLRDHGVPALIRRMYYAYCAEVLDAIGELTRGDITPHVVRFGEWLKALYQEHGRATVFTLNYDLLAERMLIDDNILGLQYSLTDFFSGLPERTTQLTLVPGEDACTGRLFYPADPPDRPIHLHHLHGCLTHFRRQTDGEIFKLDASAIREQQVYRRLAEAPEVDFVPSVILGSRKTEKSLEWPFAYAFLSLEQAVRESRTVVIAGYSFRDEGVNQRLRGIRGERRWIVVDQQESDASADAFRTVVEGVLTDAEPEYVLGGFESELPEIG